MGHAFFVGDSGYGDGVMADIDSVVDNGGLSFWSPWPAGSGSARVRHPH